MSHHEERTAWQHQSYYKEHSTKPTTRRNGTLQVYLILHKRLQVFFLCHSPLHVCNLESALAGTFPDFAFHEAFWLAVFRLLTLLLDVIIQEFAANQI